MKSVRRKHHIELQTLSDFPRLELDPGGMTGIVVGWGRTSEGGTLASVVQEVQVPILSLNQCRGSKYKPSRITSNMICAGKGVQDSCQVNNKHIIFSQGVVKKSAQKYIFLHFLQGDSGGPLLVNSGGDEKYELVG